MIQMYGHSEISSSQTRTSLTKGADWNARTELIWNDPKQDGKPTSNKTTPKDLSRPSESEYYQSLSSQPLKMSENEENRIEISEKN